MPEPKTHPPMTYLPVPVHAPQVTIHDHLTDTNWLGPVHEGVIHDRSGVINPFDIDWRYTIHRDGQDVSDEFALADPHDDTPEG